MNIKKLLLLSLFGLVCAQSQEMGMEGDLINSVPGPQDGNSVSGKGPTGEEAFDSPGSSSFWKPGQRLPGWVEGD